MKSYGRDIQEVKHFTAIFPGICVTVLCLAFVCLAAKLEFSLN